MVKKTDSPLYWESWQAEFSEAARAWERLVPGSTHVGVLDGTIYLVRGPAGTSEEMAALGWEYSADGVRSMHPTPNKRSALAKANRRLLTISKRLTCLDGVVDSRLAASLQHAVNALVVQLDGQPDPPTQQQRDAVRKVDERLLDIRSAAARERAIAAEAERKLEDERQQARLLAEELHRLQNRPAKPTTAAELALQERRAQQLRIAETAFGRAALQILAETHERAPGTWRQLSAFNGCGGQKWDNNAPVKERGKGYDHARRALGKMVDCGLIGRVGAGQSRRGGFRIADEGLQLLPVLLGE